MGGGFPRPEILAPAGSMESLTAAVCCGADAVYLGAGRFNARQNAKNFTLEVSSDHSTTSLGEAVEFCHARGVKVHLALNTLVREEEMREALYAARVACEAGVDALILQDRGLALRIHAAAPDMALHASTQLSCHTPAGVTALREAGFSRVVLAREMSREEIAACAGLGAELEVFVHGALCMCMSGQCYFSAMLGGRSGNRGTCAQPCRLPFAADRKPGPGDFALSLKDLSLEQYVEDLARLGVASLKIEGRMKRPEYVAAATAVLSALADGWKPDEQLEKDLQNVFSRSGFTDGYYTSHRGKSMFGIRTRESVTAAQPAVLSRLQRLYDRETPRIPVDWTLMVEPVRPVVLEARDSEGCQARVQGPVPEPALHRPLDLDRAAIQLNKTGGTPFFSRRTTGRIGEGLTLPAAQLNALRREALDRLLTERGKPVPVEYKADRLPERLLRRESPLWRNGDRPRLLARIAREDQLAALGEADMALIPLEWAASLDKVPLSSWGVEIPRGLFGREDSARRQLHAAAQKGARYALCGNVGAVPLARDAGLLPVGGFGLNLTNAEAFQAYAREGLAGAVVSFELTFRQMSFLRESPIPAGLFAYGRQPLMLTRNCPRKTAVGCGGCSGSDVLTRTDSPHSGGMTRDCGVRPSGDALQFSGLTDRKGVRFPTMCRGGCAELLNAVPLYLADQLDSLPPVDFLYLHFTTESPDETASVLRQYRGTHPSPDGNESAQALFSQGAAPGSITRETASEKITRGLYKRGVL